MNSGKRNRLDLARVPFTDCVLLILMALMAGAYLASPGKGEMLSRSLGGLVELLRGSPQENRELPSP